jgi:cell shape-determining protein MreC
MPKGLVVGQVAEVNKKEYELHQAAIVRPAADLRRLEQVLVVTEFEVVPGEDEATPEPTE